MFRFLLFLAKSPENYDKSFGSYIGIYFEGAILIILVILLISLYRIYKISNMRMTLDLFLGFLFYTIAVFFSWIAKWFFWQYMFYVLDNLSTFYTETPFFLLLIYTFRLPMIMVIMGNYFLSMFFATSFSKNTEDQSRNNILIGRKTIEIFIIVISQIPVILNPTLEMAALTVSISFFIMLLDSIFFIPYGIKAFKSACAQDFGKKYFYIGIMAILIFNMGIMFLVDRITIIFRIPGLFDEVGYTVFYFAAWISVTVALITAIYGFIKR